MRLLKIGGLLLLAAGALNVYAQTEASLTYRVEASTNASLGEYAPMWLTSMPADGNGMYSNVPLWAQPPVSASYGIVLMFLVYRLYRKFRPLQG